MNNLNDIFFGKIFFYVILLYFWKYYIIIEIMLVIFLYNLIGKVYLMFKVVLLFFFR